LTCTLVIRDKTEYRLAYISLRITYQWNCKAKYALFYRLRQSIKAVD